MPKYLKTAQRVTEVSYFRVFDYRGQRGSGFGFPCDEHGTPKFTYEAQKESYRKCLSGEIDVVDRGVRRIESKYREPAVIECECGQPLELADPMTNECECGAFFNGSGQRLCHPRLWGEETGERFDDHGNQIGFVGDDFFED